MKRRIVLAAFLVLFLSVSLFEFFFEDKVKKWFNQTSDERIEVEVAELQNEEVMASVPETKREEENIVQRLEEGDLIGEESQDILKEYGEPVRIDLSAYGYEWWIYHLSNETFFQVGIEDDKVVTVYLSGRGFEKNSVLGETYENLQETLNFQQEVTVKAGHGTYKFELTEDDLRMRPLTKDGENWVQLYFDTYTEELMSMRLMNEEVLINQRPYSISYRGTLPELKEFSEEEWKKIEAGNEKQIFELTNIIRKKHQLEPFEWEEEVAEVAFAHSKDMSDDDYFSHTSPTKGKLSDRFVQGDVPFKLAGENIAAKYVDGLAAVEGWLNSEGHRVNLLHEEFTHLGVGVYRDYYTQNFMTPWQP
ncbi:CAP domain-containing protein [Halalkalibacter urbisdiaboli]|uniref:CAP domain-containing protein n=1 Tax=Halalkalibacter urbisdiaboli TaxID=1960589 RepID=UPI0013FE0337|nr:CAP domain-containing protein [Halalkalibacter urbisdiaboli]